MAENTNDKCDILGVSQASQWFLRIALQHNSSTLAHTYWVRPSLWLQATEKMRRLQPTVIILNLSCPMQQPLKINLRIALLFNQCANKFQEV